MYSYEVDSTQEIDLAKDMVCQLGPGICVSLRDLIVEILRESIHTESASAHSLESA